jgi:hypothetical protein
MIEIAIGVAFAIAAVPKHGESSVFFQWSCSNHDYYLLREHLRVNMRMLCILLNWIHTPMEADSDCETSNKI